MSTDFDKITKRIISGEQLSYGEATQLIDCAGNDAFALFLAASNIREHFVGNDIHLCSIVNAKSGRCPENCSFCAQSAHHKTDAPVYELLDEEKMVSGALEAEQNGSGCYGIITSGTGIANEIELERICRAIERIRTTTSLSPSCSLGIINRSTAQTLKEAGVVTYHHNLETSRSYFPQVCTTHDYEEDVNTVRIVKEVGMKVCCGGIFGLGETPEQRMELAETLRELDVDSVPLNFLNPIAGTRLAEADFITPMECLKTIALFRLMLPAKKITICGGREKNLRDLQSWIFFAGANGTMIGNYLTTTGRPADQDWQMLHDLQLSVSSCCSQA
jgi:biotin synthase